MLEPLRADAERRARRELGRNGKSRARPTHGWSAAAEGRACRMVGGAHRPPEGDRRLDRRQGRVSNTSTTSPTPTSRASASPARSRSRACRRTASLAVDEDDELIDELDAAERRHRRDGRPPTDFAADGARKPARPPACSRRQGRPHHLHRARRLARQATSAPRAAIMEGETRAPRRHLHRPRIRHRRAARSRRRRARGGRRRLRRADRLRLQFRRPFLRARPARPRADPEGAHEPRPAHGRRAEEHRHGQPVRRLRRARHRDRGRSATARSASRSTASTCSSRRPARSTPAAPTGIALWFIDTDYNEESFFVRHAYFLGAQRSLQGAEDDAEGRDRRGSLGEPLQRHLAPVPEARHPAGSP